MDKLVTIQAGESLPFEFDRNGDSISGWTCTIYVKQYPDDAAIFSRVVGPSDEGEKWTGFLTQSETVGLTPGLYYLIGNLINLSTDEEEQIPVRFHVSKKWV